jgi:hypothetical protein
MSEEYDVDAPAPSRFMTRSELVYVRPQTAPSQHPDGATNPIRPSTGLEKKNYMENEFAVFQVRQTEADGGRSGPAQHKKEFQAELNARPHEDSSNR